ncbi:glycosyltransferase [Candidatus Saccharibacteria bacterium]|nr:glycosyltransferase [Candidatus Saccharibacteria bacterium]
MNSSKKNQAKSTPKKDVATSRHAIRYFFVGVGVTLVNYILFTILSNLIIKNNDFLWLSNMIATVITIIVGYIAHSNITWKERNVTKSSIIRFFIWNILIAIIVNPALVQFFSIFTPVYEFAHNITTAINLPFTYEFVLTTGSFVFTAIVVMILNFLFYDRFVFPKSHSPKITTSKSPILELSIRNQEPKVSIVVPIYNTEKYLKACLDSITSQTYKNLEIILVDDGATDDSGKIADKYAKKDSRITVIHQENQGQSTARNNGIKKATGDYISFIDADDKIKPTFITDLLTPFSDANASLSVCGMHYKRLKQNTANDVYINPLRPPRKSESRKAYILYLLAVDGRMYSSVNKLYRTKTVKSLQFDKTLNFAEDTKFVLDYLKKAKGEISFVLEPLYIYNFGTSTSTINRTAVNWQNWQTSYQNLKSWLGPHSTIAEKFWLHTIHLRWRISFIRSKKRTK